MPTIDGAAAARTLLAYGTLSKTGACLYYVWLAMKAHGATSSTTYPTAYSAWLATKRRHTDRNPPAGATVYWGRRRSDGNMAGDITISLGGGKVVATDYPGWGRVGIATLDQRQAQIGREYLGWSEDFLGNTTVVLGSTASTSGGGSWTDTQKQMFLVSIGLDTGGVGNGWGSKSKAATAAFQRLVGLDDDGVFGKDTTAVAKIIAAGRNATSRAVKDIQARLNKLGFSVGKVDNAWGNHTSLGAYRYQRSVKLTADAVWGAKSDAKAFPPKPAPTPSPAPAPAPRPSADADNPKGLPEVTPVYPGAKLGLTAPLGDGLRSLKGTTPVSPIIDRFIIHHTATTADQLAYFSTRNDRSSCPTWYLRKDGSMIELIRPGRKPASSGPDWNYRSVAVETLDADSSWNVTAAQIEALARAIAWLAGFDGKTLDGVPVSFKIDRAHVLGHRDVMATECPGDYLYGKLGAIIARAQAIREGAQSPDPDVTVKRSWLQSLVDSVSKMLGGKA